MDKALPPVAKKIPVALSVAGYDRVDDYFWLNRRDNPEVIEYIDAENTYTRSAMKDTEMLQEKLFREITSRIRQNDQTVPFFKNGYYIYIRYEQGREYPVYCRKKGNMEAPEEILINCNEWAKDCTFFQMGSLDISPDNRMMAFSIDTVGRRLFTIMIKDLNTGQILEDRIDNTNATLGWANDSKTLFYGVKNVQTLRSEAVMLHTLFSGTADRIVYFEADEAFDLSVYRSKSERMIWIMSASNTATEYRFLDAGKPFGEMQLVQAREKDMEYYVTHDQDKFYIVTNDQAKNFRLMETSVNKPSKEYWKELIPNRQDVFLEDIEVFRNYLVVSERKNGLVQLCIRSVHNLAEQYYLDFGEEVYTAQMSYNLTFDTDFLRFDYASLTTPNSVYQYNMRTREKVLLKQEEVLGGFKPDDYATRRLYAKASDGTEVPVSLVYRKNTAITGQNPLLLYGYGAYGMNDDPDFSIARLSILDRGFIYAIAHIRGSQYLGREWYDGGKLLNKRNTFTDFIACAEYLIEQKYTDADHIFATGGSAGGLLAGAVANMRPDLFKGIIAEVPFVDLVTTMSDESIPLTVGEYEEWGNPKDETYCRYMLSYSPYDNVIRQNYPNMLVTAGLHDSQVQYWEPAKWVAKLRDAKTDRNLLLLHTDMDSGHGGASGRFSRYRDTILEYAFLCKLVGIQH